MGWGHEGYMEFKLGQAQKGEKRMIVVETPSGW